VLARARSFVAISEWAADADQATLDGLGVTGTVPCEATFRRGPAGHYKRSWTASQWTTLPRPWAPDVLSAARL
jgi:hypothetical protein